MSAIYRSAAGERAVRARYLELLDRWPVPAQRLHVPTRQGDTFVLACGPEDAPPVVALHGSGSNAVAWLGQVGPWARCLRVYAVDMIGEPGLSAPSRPPLTGDAYADWLTEVLDGLGLTRTAMVGLSLGGWLALEFATHHPDRVTGLVLLNPGGLGRRRIVPPLIGAALSRFGPAGRRRGRRLTLGPEAVRVPATPEAARVRAAVAGLFALVVAHFRFRLEALPRFGDEALGRLRMPVLAVLGARDAMLDARGTARRLARAVPHATVRVLPDAGHLLPDQTATVLDFLRTPETVPTE